MEMDLSGFFLVLRIRYIREYNKAAKPIKWTYTDPSRRIRGTKSCVTAH